MLSNFPSSNSSPLPDKSQSQPYEELASDSIRKLRLLLIICRILIGLLLVSIVSNSVVGLLFEGRLFTFTPLFFVIALVGTIGAFSLAKAHKLVRGSQLLIGSMVFMLAFTYLDLGTDVPIMVFFLLPMFLSVLLLDTRSVIMVTAFCIVFTVGLYIFQNLVGIYIPPELYAVNKASVVATSLFITVFMLPILIIIVLLPAREQSRALQTQIGYLRQTLQQLELRQRTGESVSQQVLKLAAELKTTANQQAGGSQEQASTVEQVNTSVGELSKAAGNIEELVVQVNNSIDIIGTGSQLIEDTTTLSLQQSEAGTQAVEQTIQVSQEVGELYQNLLSILDDLNIKNSSMRLILQILTSVASETHLLALNAAIEAAGAGEYGSRFEVVAQAVKELAARSSAASQQVVDIIEQIQSASQTAIQSARQGYQKTQEMQHVVEQAGKTIGQLSEVCQQSQSQASEINQATQEVKGLTQIIKVATFHQRTASEQVLNALSDLRIVAEQNAESSSQVSSTATNLEQMSHHLSIALMS